MDYMALSEWIRWLYFHGLGGSATMEYSKIVITNETEERITHNIFYTAITRTKNKLKIYWSPETEKAVLDRFVQKKYTKDEGLLSALHSLEMAKSKKAR